MIPKCSPSASASCWPDRFLPALAVAAALALFLCPPTRAEEEAPTSFAVLDVDVVLGKLLSWQDTQDQLEAEADQVETLLAEQQKAIDRIQAELQYFKPGSPDYEKRTAELATRRRDLAIQSDKLYRALEEKARLALEETRQSIAEATAAYAAANGIDLVLDARTVLHATAGHDISLKVAFEMNKRYKEDKPNGESTPPEEKP